jgi:hypothetical protein
MRQLVVAAVALLVLGASIALWHEYSAREMRRSALRQEIARLERVQHDIDQNGQRVNRSFTAYFEAVRRAEAASDKRHDDAVNGRGSTASNLALATTEAAQVSKAQATLRSVVGGLDRFASLCNSVLGDEAVKQFGTDSSAMTTSMALGLQSWNRAVSDIVDDDKLVIRGDESTLSRSDVEHFYSASEEAQARYDGMERSVDGDAKHLLGMLEARKNDAKTRLART